MKVVELRIENQKDVLGLTVFCPRFSWRFENTPSGFLQTLYRLQVSRERDFLSVAWDSGMIRSESSHLVPYSGPALIPKVRYWARVLAQGIDGLPSDWSCSVWFEMAPAPDIWRPSFVGVTALDRKTQGTVRQLRRRFDVPFAPLGARLRCTALGLYEISVNGEKAGDALLTPGWTAYQKRLAYQTFDVSDQVKMGENSLVALVAPGWYSGEVTWLGTSQLYGRSLGLAAELEVWAEDGQRLSISTDPFWEIAESPLRFAEIYHGETYDARLEGCESWEPVAVIPSPSISLIAQDGPPVRRQLTLAAKKILTPNGEHILDFGRVLTGWVRFSVNGNVGERVILSHAETLDAKGNFYTKNLRRARNRIEYTLKGGGIETFEPRFSFQGFRYVRIDEWPEQGSASRAPQECCVAIVVHSEMETTLEFSCSHPALNRLHQNIGWSWIGNAVDIPTDCPQRNERLGWTGDAQIFVATACRLRAADQFFVKWLRDMALDQEPDGSIPFVVPDALIRNPRKKKLGHWGTSGSSGWGDAAVVVPWQVWLASGNLRVLDEFWPMMKKWVDFCWNKAGDRLIWDSGFHFGDWVALDAKEGSLYGATPTDLIATAYFANSAHLLSQAAKLLGKKVEGRTYAKLHAGIVDAFQREFVTPNGRLAARTQTAHVLALVFGLLPAEHRERAGLELGRLLDENDCHLTTGFLGTPVLCEALTLAGRQDQAYQLLLKEDYPSWLYQISRGATTIWEHWDGLKPNGRMWSATMNSFNHYAYGAVGDWIYRNLGGISLDLERPGWKRVILEPRPGGGILWAQQRIKGPYGRIRLDWKIEGESWDLTFEIPPNSSAILILPEGRREYGAGIWQVSVRSPYL